MNSLTLIKNRLPVMFFGLSVAVSLVFGLVSQFALSRSTRGMLESNFEAFADHKSEQLTSLFAEIDFDLEILAQNPFTVESLVELESQFSELGVDAKEQLQKRYIEDNPFPAGEKHKQEVSQNADAYDRIHLRTHRYFRHLVEDKGYYDVFLIDAAGNIVYSVFKELDYATNLSNGEFADSGLGRAYTVAMSLPKSRHYFDTFAPYAPSYMAPAAFISTPLFDENQNRIGVLAVQLPVDRINARLQAAEWLGERGKVLIIDENMQLHGVSARDVELEILDVVPSTPAIERGLAKTRSYFDNSQGISGNRVVAQTSSVSYQGHTWGIIVEGERNVLYAAVNRTRNLLILTSFAITLVMCGLGLLIARSFTRPLAEIDQIVDEMAEGNYDRAVSIGKREDEFGSIATSVEELRGKLLTAQQQDDAFKAVADEQSFVVDKLTTGLTRLREGDLTFVIHDEFSESYDSLRVDFNKSIETLNHALAQVVESAESISRGSREISQASDDLSNRTENQAATLEETAAALDELTASVKSAADGAKSVEDIVTEAKNEATQSGEVVRRAVEAMNEIETSSDQISQIIGVIDDIAFQTNLLALNAGVEAARAGESGKGFSVVASEVRALAQRSSEAAHEIKALISGSTHQVERGVELVGKAGSALESIAGRVNHIAQLVSDIAASASEQSAGLGEINIGVNQLDQVTQQNAAMVEEATAASHLLQKDTNILADLVDNFSIRTDRNQTVLEDSDEDEGEPSMVYDEAVTVKPKPMDHAPKTAIGGWQDF